MTRPYWLALGAAVLLALLVWGPRWADRLEEDYRR